MVNEVKLIGHLGADPESRTTKGGVSTCELRVATSETWTDKDGEKQEKTEWHRVVCWEKLADNCAKYLKKGRMVYVSGSIQTRNYEKDGVVKYVTEIKARDVKFLGGGDGAKAASAEPAKTENVKAPAESKDPWD